MQTRLVPIAALQHYAYCPRQCALIHNEQVWQDNYFTAKGQVLHQRVDSGEPETRKGVRFERSVVVEAPCLGVKGKLDLLEVEIVSGRYTPVEYKSGKAKSEQWDAIQVCAQAMCLEEMLGITICEGALWYWRTRKRQVVALDTSLRQLTLQTIEEVKALLDCQQTPKEVASADRCGACSLNALCQPDLIRNDHSADYWESLFKP